MVIKNFVSNNFRVQALLNLDRTLKSKQKVKENTRPEYECLREEILKTRKEIARWANEEPPDYFPIPDQSYAYLGMITCHVTDRIFLRPKGVILRSKKNGRADILIRNLKEFKTFLELGKFQKAHLAAIVHGVFCPPNHLSAVYSNVARVIMRHILTTSEEVTKWTDKIPRNQFTICIKK